MDSRINFRLSIGAWMLRPTLVSQPLIAPCLFQPYPTCQLNLTHSSFAESMSWSPIC